MVLMAIVNSKYEFIYVDIGKNGRISDGGILLHTDFYKCLIEDSLKLPERSECVEKFNFIFVGDEAFALHQHILKPFSQKNLTYERRIYNYRLARARNVVENAFGVLSARFRIFHTAINMSPINIQYTVLAACVLHNYLIRKKSSYAGNNVFDKVNLQTNEILQNGTWRQETAQVLIPLHVSNNNKSYASLEAKQNRNRYLRYFNGDGKVPWQDDMLRKGKS